MKLGIFVGNEKRAGAFANAMALSQAHGFAENGSEVFIVIEAESESVKISSEIDEEFSDLNIKLVFTKNPVTGFAECDWVI